MLFGAALLLSASCADGRAPRFGEDAPSRSVDSHPDVVISRIMIDPVAVPDEHGEWIELTNRSAAAVDLKGWKLLSDHDAGFVIPGSLVIRAGGTVTLGRDADPNANGGVKVDLQYTGLTLGNGHDWLALHDPAGITADSVAWERAPRGTPLVHGGVAVRDAPPARGDSVTRPAPSPVPARHDSLTSRELVVRVLDIGQGDAILVQNGGSNVLIDGGPKPEALGEHLDALGLNGATIDAVILTHVHADHYQGLRELFASRRRITVRYFWENQDASPNVTLAKLRDSIASRVRAGSLTYRDTDDPCVNGQPICTISLKGGAKLHIMRPDPNGQGANNRSPAIKIVGPDSASFTMWLAGDAEHDAIDYFLRAGYAQSPGMRVDVLKADHHGSCNGVSDAYLDALRPSIAVASVGAVNDYGHMHEQAKAAFARHHVTWYRTDQNGTVTLRSAGLPDSAFTVTVDRAGQSLGGPSDRRSTQPGCSGM